MERKHWKDLTGIEKIRIYVSLVCLAYLGWLIFHGSPGR